MEKKEYLNISKASDIKNPKERRLYRFFEMIPAILSLGTLLGVFVFSWLVPSWVAIFIICFCFYYLFRILYFSVHQIAGYFRVKSNMKKEWLKELRRLPKWKPNEIGGKGSNAAWAGKEAKKLIDHLKIPYENILFSAFDIDTKVFPGYFACVTWHYLTEKNPMQASYQPVPVYNNNIWSAPAFSRVVSTSNTFWQMIQQERAEKLTTYSSHTIPAKVFFEVEYPANVVSDDSRIFWKAYLYYDGDYRVVPVYYMVSMDAVMAKNFWQTAINQYKQQKRWAWGCDEIPYIIFGFLNNRKISTSAKFSQIYTILDGFWSWATAALLLFLLGWLPILLGGQKFNFTVLSFNLPILTSRIMTISMIGMLVSAVLSTMLLPPVPKEFKWYVRWYKKSTVFLQWIFLPVTLILFGALPALDAQIRLMLGRYMGFWVTEKIRK
ncbi:MAG: hypothetical protein NT026_01285 [Candidatus Staskawiczbacteria bacterium]|nr:hypothetical protein [Candidatus Staskawiczbacteria bacterium]